MHAVTIVDGELIWREHPDPEPGTDDLVVRVRAAGLNGADLHQRAGRYPAPPGSPADIPGLELAGEVVAAGAKTRRFAADDRVMAVVGGGAQAELCLVHERHALPVPEGVPWEQAGAFAEVFTTAYDAMFSRCGLSMGDRLCVHGGAGGVGLAAVQLGAAAGATVVATVRDPARREAVAGFGAIVVDPGDFVAAGPFDVILELVGGPNLPGDIEALAAEGRIAVIGIGAGRRAEIDLGALMGKRGRIVASVLRSRTMEEKATVARGVEGHVLPLLAAGRLATPIEATFPLAEAAAAYDRFAAGGKLGKIVLVN
ncbi:MAG: zinc-binding dehydrogenase [Acidimicrobiia bacterium]